MARLGPAFLSLGYPRRDGRGAHRRRGRGRLRSTAARSRPCSRCAPRPAPLRFACALQREGETLAWVVLDEAGEPLDVRARSARSPRRSRSARRRRSPAPCWPPSRLTRCCSARSAWSATTRRSPLRCARCARRSRRCCRREEGVRVAEPGYLDRVAVTAAMVGDRFDYLKDIAYGVSAKLSGAPGESGEALAESLWAAVRILARDGAPDRFREAVEGGMAAAQAFARGRARQLRDRAGGPVGRVAGRSARSAHSRGTTGRAAPTQEPPIASAETLHLLPHLTPMTPSTTGTRHIAHRRTGDVVFAWWGRSRKPLAVARRLVGSNPTPLR